MRAGQLRNLVIIEQPSLSKNEIGEVVPSWSTFCSCWAAIEPAVGRSYYAANQLESKVDGRVRIRYREGILPTMRIKFGERILSIVSVVHPQENHRELHLMYAESLD